MQCLFVSPDSNLETVSELVAAAGVDRIDILAGTVTGREVIQKLATGAPREFVIAGHGNRHATAMSDGLLDPELLIHAMKSRRTVRVILFNACESIEQVAMIFRHVPTVWYGIGWAGDVEDAAARTFAVTYFTTLRLSGNHQKAFDTGSMAISKFHPHHRLPILLNGRVRLAQYRMIVAYLVTALVISLVWQSFLALATWIW